VADELGAPRSRSATIATTWSQTFFLNMFFGGKLKGMPPKLVSDDGKHVVIRPLAYVARKGPRALRRAPAVPDHPVHLCGSQENLQRKQVGAMLREWEFVRQEPQLGTGHAVQQAAPLLPDDGTTLILNGDVPLIEPPRCSALVGLRRRRARAADHRAGRSDRLRPHRARRSDGRADAIAASSSTRTPATSARSARSTPA
jgi:hypothetical protein